MNSEPSGYKLDEHKTRWDLMPSDALEEIAKVLTWACQRKDPPPYPERNWEQGMAWHRPFGAMMRHAWAWWRGEDLDPQSGLSHLAHVGCCVLFLLSYWLRGDKINDDRERLDQRDQRALKAR